MCCTPRRGGEHQISLLSLSLRRVCVRGRTGNSSSSQHTSQIITRPYSGAVPKEVKVLQQPPAEGLVTQIIYTTIVVFAHVLSLFSSMRKANFFCNSMIKEYTYMFCNDNKRFNMNICILESF